MGCLHQDFAGSDPVVRQLGIGAAALRYQGQGYAVLALARGRKRPHRILGDSGGVHWASIDPQAAKWSWSRDRAANLGVACGSPSRLIVVDLDVKGGRDGPGELTRFMAQYQLGIRDAAVAATPSGGTHLWLRTPDGMRVQGRPGILPGVDILGDGNLVVAAPSMAMVSGRGGEQVPIPYRWTAGCYCAAGPVPPWMLAWIASAGPGMGSAGSGSGGGGEEDVDLDALRERGAAAGTRNRELYRAACKLHRTLAPQDVLAQLEVMWRAGDTSGLPWREVLTLNESARKFIDGQQQRERALRDAWVRSGMR
jgi:hypothetical protein